MLFLVYNLLFGLSPINVSYFANLIGLAYCNESVLLQNTCVHCSPEFEYVKRIQKANIVAVIMKNQSHLILSFQGSVVTADWLLDAQILLVTLPKIPFYSSEIDSVYQPTAKVHQGFRNGYLKIRTQVQTILTKYQLPVVILGHSMGSSIATIAAVDISQHLPVQLIGAESPRTGNAAFISLLESRVSFIYRMTNMNDIVPFLPGLRLGYRHSKNEIWLNGTEAVFCEQPEDTKCITSTYPNNNMAHHAYLGAINVGGC